MSKKIKKCKLFPKVTLKDNDIEEEPIIRIP